MMSSNNIMDANEENGLVSAIDNIEKVAEMDNIFELMLESLETDVYSLSFEALEITPQKLYRVLVILYSHLQRLRYEDKNNRMLSPAVNQLSKRRVVTLSCIMASRILLNLMDLHGIVLIIQHVSNSLLTQLEKYVSCGNTGLATAPLLLTAENIVPVVLDVRKQLEHLSNDPQFKPFIADAGKKSTQVKPEKVLLVDEKDCTNSSIRLQNRSVLASEGAHLLISEKVQSYKFRNSSSKPSFNVSTDITKKNAAADRRLKSHAYGNAKGAVKVTSTTSKK